MLSIAQSINALKLDLQLLREIAQIPVCIYVLGTDDLTVYEMT